MPLIPSLQVFVTLEAKIELGQRLTKLCRAVEHARLTAHKQVPDSVDEASKGL